MTRKRRAFTLVEILATMAIIAILAGMLLLGARAIGASARAKKTQVLLKNLQGMLAEFESRGGRMEIINDQYSGQETMPVGPVADNFAATNADLNKANGALMHTQNVMLALMTVPENKAIVDKLPPEVFLMDPNTKQRVAGPILLDAWNSPIIFAPGRTPGNVNWGAAGMTIAKNTNSSFKPPDGKGMFISAGEDTDFSKGDDNLYSFEK